MSRKERARPPRFRSRAVTPSSTCRCKRSIDGDYAINVHLSADEIDTYIACGDIGGVVTTDEGEDQPELIIGLGELNDSGYTRNRLARR